VRPRRHSDPTLDADLRAWTDADPSRPRIAILGPVTVDAPGQLPNERVRFYAEVSSTWPPVAGAAPPPTSSTTPSGPTSKSKPTPAASPWPAPVAGSASTRWSTLAP
jgi:hypothetical protein